MSIATVVELYPDEEVEYRDDCLILAAILHSVLLEMLATLRGKRSMQAALEELKTIHVGVKRVRESKAQQRWREFVALIWKGESVKDFFVCITGLTNNLRTLGDNILDVNVVHKMLDIILEHLEQVVVATETFLDLNIGTVEVITRWLCVVEQHRHNKAPVVDNQGRLLMTQDECMAKLKIGGNTGSSGGSGGSGGPTAEHGTNATHRMGTAVAMGSTSCWARRWPMPAQQDQQVSLLRQERALGH
jgi:hypothetical protein